MSDQVQSNELHHLTVSILGNNQSNLIHQLLKTVTQCDCNIIDSKFSGLGSGLGGHLLISGRWHEIAKLENLLPGVCKDLQLNLQIQRTTYPAASEQKWVSYGAYILALDEPGILEKVCGFFSMQDIVIVELNNYIYPSRHTGQQMLTITLQVNVPADLHAADLRERFMLLCDDMDLDGVMELDKY